MRLPIDTGTVKFAAAGPAEPVLDYETRAPKLDKDSYTIDQVVGLRLEPVRSTITIRRFIVPIQVRNSFSRQSR
jgi:hypothetical protein